MHPCLDYDIFEYIVVYYVSSLLRNLLVRGNGDSNTLA